MGRKQIPSEMYVVPYTICVKGLNGKDKSFDFQIDVYVKLSKYLDHKPT